MVPCASQSVTISNTGTVAKRFAKLKQKVPSLLLHISGVSSTFPETAALGLLFHACIAKDTAMTP